MSSANKNKDQHIKMADLESATILSETPTFSTIKMNLEDWLKIPDYPHQTDTTSSKRLSVSYWKKIKRQKRFVQNHLTVVFAAMVSGLLYKIDGHIRTIHWASGYLPDPKEVIVHIHKLNSQQELIDLYEFVQFGNREGFENVIVVYQELGLNLRSNRLKHGFIIEALNIALRGAPRTYQDKRVYREEIDIRKAVEVFKPEIEIVDAIDPPPDIFLTGVLAAAFIMLGTDKQYIPFFELLAKKRSSKKEGYMDPIEAILSYLESLKSKRIGKAKLQTDLCARTIRAIVAWNAGKQSSEYWMKNTIRPTQIGPYLRQLKSIKNITRISTL